MAISMVLDTLEQAIWTRQREGVLEYPLPAEYHEAFLGLRQTVGRNIDLRVSHRRSRGLRTAVLSAGIYYTGRCSLL